jgi:hypothetical protein
LLLTAQGLDFEDANWSYHLIGPDGTTVYSDGTVHNHGAASGHTYRCPDVVAARGDGRLTLMVQRDNADYSAWVGSWQVMVGYRDREMDGMVMAGVGELILPVAAGPVRGPRWSRATKGRDQRPATRRILDKDVLANLSVPTLSTNQLEGSACSVVINVYAQTRLALELVAKSPVVVAGEKASFELAGPVPVGSFTVESAIGRLISPAVDVAARVSDVDLEKLGRRVRLSSRLRDGKFDNGLVLAELEAKDPDLGSVRDEQAKIAQDGGEAPRVQIADTSIPGGYHLGMYVSGRYFPDGTGSHDGGHGGHGRPAMVDDAAGDIGEPFTRIVTASLGAVAPEPSERS